MLDENERGAVCEKPLRVLFIVHECRVRRFTEAMEYACWYEGAFAFYGGDRVQVGIAYEAWGDLPGSPHPGGPSSTGRPSQDLGITYYPLEVNLQLGATGPEWEAARRALIDVVDRFRPDIIQCFGSEWPHAAIAEDVDVPVVVHMMGFLNIYYPSIDMAVGRSGGAPKTAPWRAAIRKLLFWRRNHGDAVSVLEQNAAFERRVMRANRFFLGRTEWDKNIVKYYAPGSRYFEVSEPIRFPFLEEAGSWRYHLTGTLRLFTLASADDRKGLEIILRTAKLLKELVGIEFEWRIAGHKEGFDRFERRCGIRHDEVNIHLLGMLEAEDVVDELKGADLCIHASIIDNSPRAVCESQLVGCPTISSNVGGVPQLVEHGVTGFLYPYNEPHTLAFLIANLYGQREQLTAVSKAASSLARRRHDPKTIVERMLDVYKEVIASYEK